ncbi:hypothetical protein BJ138DRAFT_1126146 [Hygrophoropsis aurantiaca]|uniref:Uncharacterized protein n=1 Tax=Hygrophoropsis aurantiaca TaxID=72124 RepID=A0ACB8ADY6_9AGAM|nr:hypothetical protein BJ138DRAFT_1126146 [Hygrophoropsis aurantiaca]
MGITVLPAIDNCIEFQMGGGFDGALPEYHGHVENGVALTPMFCPWCVHDEDLSMGSRMEQYTTHARFAAHLRIHTATIDTDSVCALPSCGTQQFSPHDLLCHMITVHRVDLCGSVKAHPTIRRLKLPVPEFNSAWQTQSSNFGGFLLTSLQYDTDLRKPADSLTLTHPNPWPLNSQSGSE